MCLTFFQPVVRPQARMLFAPNNQLIKYGGINAAKGIVPPSRQTILFHACTATHGNAPIGPKMLKIVPVTIDEIYIPTARRGELDQSKLETVTESILGGDKQKPIKVRKGKGRFVLVEGIHRLEASKALGETEIGAYIVQAPKF